MVVSFDGPGSSQLEPAGRAPRRVAARRDADVVGRWGAIAHVGSEEHSW